ncbi:uncharacterized protein [Rutidosis leptorrhynchoides]|uniref:uncharacterized protein n=1 Tax=Rutidosis leptorrhynchoides TaxID=125765 RepID=UPI003A99FEE8
MGNCCVKYGFMKKAKPKRVLQVVKLDGKVLEFNSPVLVKEILANDCFSSCPVGVGCSRQDSVRLPLDYELKLGEVYYILPSFDHQLDESTTNNPTRVGSAKRIKVVITKHQLQRLLTKKISLKDVLLQNKRRNPGDSPRNRHWRPKLESIPEGTE